LTHFLNLSLGVPLKNSAPFLLDLFNSLEGQSQLPGEIFFVDDRSVDESGRLVEEFARRHSDWNISIYCNRQTLGIAGTYNRIVELSSLNWIQILDADDYLLGNYYETLAPFLIREFVGIVTAVRSNARIINIANTLWGWLIPQRLPRWLPVLGSFATRSGIIYAQKHLKKLKFSDPAFDGSDILHLIQLRAKGNYAYVNKACVFYRVHAMSATSQGATGAQYLRLLRQKQRAGRLYLIDYYLRKKIFRPFRN
jgi:glycosyltransferase involved in cell wall biosynthesis